MAISDIFGNRVIIISYLLSFFLSFLFLFSFDLQIGLLGMCACGSLSTEHRDMRAVIVFAFSISTR